MWEHNTRLLRKSEAQTGEEIMLDEGIPIIEVLIKWIPNWLAESQ